MLFLDFCGKSGKRDVGKIERVDLEAFIEQEQNRGLRISTVRTRLACIIAFFHFLMEQEVIPGSLLKRSIKLKLPDTLPRAMNPADVRKLLSVINDTRDRALILLLLRTGIRIGEALGLQLNDLDIRDRKIHLFEGEKNSMGRVVYLSDDALFALKLWLRRRDQNQEFVFYGQGRKHLCYSTGRSRFVKYLQKAGLEQKGYTVHCLRHTFASELLNAGMRLECLQQLLGHQDIEVTRRYARLTDRTREEEYFRAMAIIEKGGIDGDY
jgi:integrase/recombinase XerD